MEQSPFWEAYSRSGAEENFYIFRNLGVHYHVNKNRPPDRSCVPYTVLLHQNGNYVIYNTIAIYMLWISLPNLRVEFRIFQRRPWSHISHASDLVGLRVQCAFDCIKPVVSVQSHLTLESWSVRLSNEILTTSPHYTLNITLAMRVRSFSR
jgi:hypothetical protein